MATKHSKLLMKWRWLSILQLIMLLKTSYWLMYFKTRITIGCIIRSLFCIGWNIRGLFFIGWNIRGLLFFIGWNIRGLILIGWIIRGLILIRWNIKIKVFFYCALIFSIFSLINITYLSMKMYFSSCRIASIVVKRNLPNLNIKFFNKDHFNIDQTFIWVGS